MSDLTPELPDTPPVKPAKAEKQVDKSGYYFTDTTQESIVKYNQEEDSAKRSIIYATEIHVPLDMLVENIINRFKFPYITETYDDIKQEALSYLVERLPKFQGAKGQAFGYFSVICKNHLIWRNTKHYKELKKNTSLDQDDSLFEIMDPDEEMRQHNDSGEMMNLMVQYWEDNISTLFKKQKDMEIAHAVINLFRDRDSVENFNKKSLYILIREQTDAKTQHITKVIGIMRNSYDQMAEMYRSSGHIS